MADYNVNMKQWNGTSFDNVLPLAYNAKQLGGQSLAEIKQWVHDNGLLLYTGQYIGTGAYGVNNPTSITFPFEPIILIGPVDVTGQGRPINISNYMETFYVKRYWLGYDVSLKISEDRKTISWYSSSRANEQLNASGRNYYYAAIGGYDMGGQTEWTITQSGTWTVPKTGRYMLELYGGGGGTVRTSGAGYTGGSSCQHYDSIVLNRDDVFDVTIGVAGEYGSDGGSTIFSSYSVKGGGGASSDAAGTKSGNYGRAGQYQSSNMYGRTRNDGVYGTTYGAGAGNNADYSATAGAVYIKYLGA